MKKQRLKLQELKDLKPSRTNMIELVCDDEFYTNDLKVVTVYSVGADYAYCISENDASSKLRCTTYPTTLHSKKSLRGLLCIALSIC